MQDPQELRNRLYERMKGSVYIVPAPRPRSFPIGWILFAVAMVVLFATFKGW